MDLLGAYSHILSLSGMVGDILQTSAFLQEEMIDDVLDWSTSDDMFLDSTAYGRASPGAIRAYEADQAASMMGPPADALASASGMGRGYNPIRGQSVASERLARRQYKAHYVQRYTMRSNDAPGGLQGRRMYDGVGSGKHVAFPRGTHMEIKPGTHGLNERVRRQVAFDSYMIHSERQPVKWVLHVKQGQEINPRLRQELNMAGVPFEIQVVP